MQIQFLLKTQLPDKLSNIIPQKGFCSCFTSKGTYRLTEHSWCLSASEEQQQYEDDLHFTPVILHEKDTNSQTKNNHILFMLNIVATF